MFAEPTGGSRCGFFLSVYDLIWPEGGLCELEEEKKPVEDAVCGRRRKRPWLARLHKLINEEQLRVEGRIDCTPQVHSAVQNILHADAQEHQSAPS